MKNLFTGMKMRFTGGEKDEPQRHKGTKEKYERSSEFVL
jgi:hypothetical protein